MPRGGHTTNLAHPPLFAFLPFSHSPRHPSPSPTRYTATSVDTRHRARVGEQCGHNFKSPHKDIPSIPNNIAQVSHICFFFSSFLSRKRKKTNKRCWLEVCAVFLTTESFSRGLSLPPWGVLRLCALSLCSLAPLLVLV